MTKRFATRALYRTIVDSRSPGALLIISLSLLAVAFFAALLVVQDTPFVAKYAHDVFIYLNAGWRLLHHQAPNVDFHAPIGPFVPVLMAAAMKLGGATAFALPLASAILCLVTVVLTLIVGHRRVPVAMLGLMLLLVGAASLGLEQFGSPYNESTYGSMFNRYGYALLLVFQLECLAPPLADERSALSRVQATISGFCILAVFFTKANFVFPALFFVPFSIAVRRRRIERVVWLGAGVLVGIVAFGPFVRFNYGGLVADYSAALRNRMQILHSDPGNFFVQMSARVPAGLGLPKVAEVFRNEAWRLFLVATAVLVFPRGHLRGRGGAPLSMRLFIAIVAVLVLCPFVVVFTNWQWGELITTPALLTIGVAWAVWRPPNDEPPADAHVWTPPPHRVSTLALSWIAAMSVVELAAPSFYSIVYSAGISGGHQLLARIEAEPLVDLKPLWADSNCHPESYVARVNEGLAVLRPLAPSIHEGLWVVDFSDPFTFALQLPPVGSRIRRQRVFDPLCAGSQSFRGVACRSSASAGSPCRRSCRWWDRASIRSSTRSGPSPEPIARRISKPMQRAIYASSAPTASAIRRATSRA